MTEAHRKLAIEVAHLFLTKWGVPGELQPTALQLLREAGMLVRVGDDLVITGVALRARTPDATYNDEGRYWPLYSAKPTPFNFRLPLFAWVAAREAPLTPEAVSPLETVGFSNRVGAPRRPRLAWKRVERIRNAIQAWGDARGAHDAPGSAPSCGPTLSRHPVTSPLSPVTP